MKCSECEFCGATYKGYSCKHSDIKKSAREYEIKRGKTITKLYNFVGYKLPKTSLYWCPLKG